MNLWYNICWLKWPELEKKCMNWSLELLPFLRMNCIGEYSKHWSLQFLYCGKFTQSTQFVGSLIVWWDSKTHSYFQLRFTDLNSMKSNGVMVSKIIIWSRNNYKKRSENTNNILVSTGLLWSWSDCMELTIIIFLGYVLSHILCWLNSKTVYWSHHNFWNLWLFLLLTLLETVLVSIVKYFLKT